MCRDCLGRLDSRGKIRHLARTGADHIVVTGCWVSLQPVEAAALPGVARVITNPRKDQLVSDLLKGQPQIFDAEPLARVPLPGLRRRTRLFVKVQDGCNNRCTFCITTVARGRARSRPIDDICRDIESALAGGTQEIVLTGVHLGSWGKDLGSDLKQLVRSILRRTAVPRLRLSSLEPWDLDREFFTLWADPRLCPHLHLPLQSGCASTLRRMARRTTPASFKRLVAAARELIPNVAITTDLIAGFPGETDAEFQESLAFVSEMNFSGGHAFTYSPRPGTAAAGFAEQVPLGTRHGRTARYLRLFAEAAQRHGQRFIGQTRAVLWESATRRGGSGWEMTGHTEDYARVKASDARPRWNEINPVKITGLTGEFLHGIIVK